MKIAVAVTGASGSLYAKRLLEKIMVLKDQVSEVSLVWSNNAKTVWEHELGDKSFEHLPFRTYAPNDFMAPFASGSASYQALIICPCSMGTVGRMYGFVPAYRANQLAVDLLGGRMSYPTSVILEEHFQNPAPIPGYLDVTMMEKILKYLGENIYKTKQFPEYEKEFVATWAETASQQPQAIKPH